MNELRESTVGATLVAQAITHWSHVSHQAFRALVAMALTAKDNASKEVPAGLYFGGHDGLVYALQFRPGTKEESKLRAVRLAVDELEEVGATVCTQPAFSGGHAVYKLTLNSIPMPRKPRPRKSREFDEQAETVNPPEAETGTPPQAETVHPPQAETPSPPYEEPLEEPLEELKEEYGVALTTQLTVTRDPADADTPKRSPPSCPDPTCELGYVYDPTKPKGQRNTHCPHCNPTLGRKNA